MQALALTPDNAAAHGQLPSCIGVRLSSNEGSDRDGVRRLAWLTGTESPTGSVLLAEINRQPVAAIGLNDGRIVADPAWSHPALTAYLTLRRRELGAIASVPSA